MLAYFDGYNDPEQVRAFVTSFFKVRNPERDHLFILHHEEANNEVVAYLKTWPLEMLQMPHVTGHAYIDRFELFAQASSSWDKDGLFMACDIRDVVFQSNPFDALSMRLKSGVNAVFVNEAIDHREMWNGAMMQMAFPSEWKKMAKARVYNCGVLGGRQMFFMAICRTIFKMCARLPNLMENYGTATLIPDQAAYSMFINQTRAKVDGVTTSNADNFVCTMAVIHYELPHFWFKDGKICNHHGKEYAIVHQYDRFTPKLTYEEGNFKLEGFTGDVKLELRQAMESQMKTRYYWDEQGKKAEVNS
jgi:hypothetical protein